MRQSLVHTPNYNVLSVMPALKRTRLTASAWRKANWCINCVLMRVMERRERDTAFHYPHQHTVDTPVLQRLKGV